MSDKRPETDADILSRSTALSYDFAAGVRQQGRRYHHDLVGHMAECDMNFQRLMQLFPTLRQDDFKCVMLLPGESGTRVELNVLKRGPYTTLLQLTQVPKQDWGSSPNMKIQLYHDTKSAEVVSYQHQSRFHGAYEYPNKRMRAPDEKEQLNRFLGEYLALCLAVGMSADTVSILGTKTFATETSGAKTLETKTLETKTLETKTLKKKTQPHREPGDEA